MEPVSRKESYDAAVKESIASIIINAVLFGIKIFGGITTNSIALITDGVHSLSDFFSSAVVIVGAKFANKEPDEEHPFGHQRIEYIASLIIAVFLIFIAFEFGKQAVERIITPEKLQADRIGFIVIGISVGLKVLISLYAYHLQKKTQSPLIKGDYIHHLSDLISTVFVLVSFAAAKIFPELIIIDAVMSLFVAAFVFYSAIGIAKEVISPLIGTRADERMLNLIKNEADKIKEISGVHDIVIHQYGQLKTIDVHAEIDADTPFRLVHEICEELGDNIHDRTGADILVHPDPIDTNNSDLNRLRDQTHNIVERTENAESFHEEKLVGKLNKGTYIFQLALSKDLSPEDEAKVMKSVEKQLRDNFPKLRDVKISIVPMFKYQ